MRFLRRVLHLPLRATRIRRDDDEILEIKVAADVRNRRRFTVELSTERSPVGIRMTDNDGWTMDDGTRQRAGQGTHAAKDKDV
jgi:hypothetical protein